MSALCADILYSSHRRFPGKSLICPDRTVAYVELDRLATRVAAGLVSLGVNSGDRVILWEENGWRWMSCYYGILRIGAVVVPCNVLLTEDEVLYIAGDSGAKVVITGRHAVPKFSQGVDRVIVSTRAQNSIPRSISLDDWLNTKTYRRPAFPIIHTASPSTVSYTSGTTGQPKGAVLSHAAVATNTALTALVHGRSESDVVVSALPCSHVYGNIVMNAAILCGMTLVLLPRFDELTILEAISLHKATIFEGVPTMYARLLESPAIDEVEMTSLRVCTVGGQGMSVAAMERVEKRFGCRLLELWGMTELAGLGMTHSVDGPRRLGSIGKPLPFCEARVVAQGEGLQDVRPGEVGELLFRGPTVTDGYFGDAKGSQSAVAAGGWLRTGDLVRQDEEGFYFLVDRAKEMFISAGYNVYPAEVERVISDCPGVSMVAVVGTRDTLKGSVPKAYVVLSKERRTTAAEVVAHCQERLASYKVPKVVVMVNDLPKTSSGKIMRRALQEV